MVIYVDMMTYSQREAQKYLWSEWIHKQYTNKQINKNKIWFCNNNNLFIIGTEPEHFSNLKNCLEPKDFLKRARSLMVVVSTAPTKNYEEFTKKVRYYNSIEPFNFIVPELLRKYEKVFLDGKLIVNVRTASILLYNLRFSTYRFTRHISTILSNYTRELWTN